MVLLEDGVRLLVDIIKRLQVDVAIDNFSHPKNQLIVDEINEMERRCNEANDILVEPDDGLELC